ncbi:hypothetical protein PORY_000073 [Pneumocystis oryctolagi]|uniref:Uncharacterized protein n=1 Tax=Pneumocystis oryctolagi TaxID=42067 RepID=A0ACB7CG60_9ASCO|nr:hypothetical protein PORY_000073 [Pneumocystis oryctolagi]
MSISQSKKESAKETIDILHEISVLLNTGLDKNSLSLCVSLCENVLNCTNFKTLPCVEMKIHDNLNYLLFEMTGLLNSIELHEF